MTNKMTLSLSSFALGAIVLAVLLIASSTVYAFPRGKGPNFERMQEELGLTDAQRQAMQEVFNSSKELCRGIENRDDFRECMRLQRDAKHHAFQEILTAEQLAILEERREGMGSGRWCGAEKRRGRGEGRGGRGRGRR